MTCIEHLKFLFTLTVDPIDQFIDLVNGYTRNFESPVNTRTHIHEYMDTNTHY